MNERPEEGAARPPARPRTLTLMLWAALFGAAAGLVAVYGISGLPRNAATASDPACDAATETAKRLGPLARGEVAAFVAASAPRRLPPFTFRDGSGKELTLADFKGKAVLLNLWATWCVPCRKEMPTLDALQRAEGGPDFAVLALNLDTRDLEKPKRFLSDIGARDLGFYEDQSLSAFEALKRAGKVLGLPTTFLVDKDGCELGVLAGPADWAGAEARALLRAAMGR